MGSSDDEFDSARTVQAATPALASVAPPHDDAPILAGRYEILALLGVGGMGAVYRARDLELDELVAVKMLRRDLLAVPGMLERFRQEVKLARRVTSPHVARTFDIGEHGGDKFITMELVDGDSLASEMTRVKITSVARAVAVATEVCAGLAAAHAVGVVHRDLKPENVLISADGTAKISDFGIARAQAAARTTSGVTGTPAYMAPEQVMGDSDVDSRADIYALGLMLYEMLTGELPWKGESAYAIASARLLAPPPDLQKARPDVPHTLAALVLECMARRREDRPKTAQDVAIALATVCGEQRDTMPRSTPRSSPSPSERPRNVKTVAVLPLRNRGAEGDEYIADGVTDDLIDSLSMADGLRVRSRGGVMGLAAGRGAPNVEPRDPRELGRELGVHVVVDGSVRRAGELLRVSIRLISVVDGFQLWAKRFERPSADMFAMGDEIARAITLMLDIDGASPRSEGSRDPITVDLYLRARHAYCTFGVEGVTRALSLFAEALARAPEDPMILAGYAMACMARLALQEGSVAAFDEALAVAERAVALAPELADAHVALANIRYHDGRYAEAAPEARLALRIAPSNADAHFLVGRIYAEAWRPVLALAHLATVQTLDPRVRMASLERARVYALLGEWDNADFELARIRLDDDDESVFLYWASRMRFAMWRRDAATNELVLAEARASAVRDHYLLRAMDRLLDDGSTDEYSASLHVTFGDKASTRRRQAFVHQLEAEVAAFRGNPASCIAAIESADLRGLNDLGWTDHCPLLGLVRRDARFAAARASIAVRADFLVKALGGR